MQPFNNPERHEAGSPEIRRGGEFVVTMRQSNGSAFCAVVALYYRHGSKVWRLREDTLVTERLVSCIHEHAPVETSILQVDPSPDKPARWHDMLTTTWPGQVLAWIVGAAVLFAAVAVAYAIGHDDDALRIAVVALVLLQVQRWAFGGAR